MMLARVIWERSSLLIGSKLLLSGTFLPARGVGSPQSVETQVCRLPNREGVLICKL